MKKAKIFLSIVSIFFVSIFVAKTSQAAGLTEIDADINVATVWTKANSPYLIKKVVTVNAPLTIEPGVILKFSNLTVNNTTAGLTVKNSFIAVGTPLEKIVFTSACDSAYGGSTVQYCNHKTYPTKGDWNGISVYPESKIPASIEYAKILYANKGVSFSTINQNDTYTSLSVKHSEIQNSSSAGVFLRFTQPTLDTLILANNYHGLEVFDAQLDKMPKIRNSSIFSNTNGVSGSESGRNSIPVDARYNWWGDPSGPYYNYSGSTEPNNLSGLGNRIIGSRVLFRPWDQSDPTIPKQPVIFVPGIGASINPDLMIGGIFSDKWAMFDHTYDGILQAFKAMGYTEGENFFIAYYDWRKSNVESAEKYLKPAIQKALLKSGANKVNIVTHSMGSLVARSYVQGGGYASDVDNLIMIAPPNKGSSDVYTAWEGGYIPKNWNGRSLMVIYLAYLQIKNAEISRYDVVHNFIPSLKELMPVYDFLHPVGDSQNLKDYLSMQEKNNFLLDLNSGGDVLNQRTRLSVILGNKQPTVNKIPTIGSDVSGVWVDGKPDPIDPQQNDANGDGEVLISSGSVASDFTDVLEYGHGQIVSKSEKIVAQRLDESLDVIFDSPTINQEIGFWSEGGGDMQITDPDGKNITKDSSGVTDSKFAAESKPDGFKIASIPNPKKGDYVVTIDAPSDGNFIAGVEYVDNTGDKDDTSSVVSGDVKKDEPISLIVNINPENTEKPTDDIVIKDVIPPTVRITSPKNGEEYFSDQILPITFSVSDNISKVENVKTEFWLDDELLTENSIDLSALSLGIHDFWINAIDQAGNLTESTLSFTVKKAEPPVVVDPISDPVTPPAPILPPEIFLPVTSSTSDGGLVLGASIENSIFQNTQSISNQKSSKKKSSHKKKKHKKKKKNMISGVAEQTKKVLGTSSSRNIKQKNVFTKSWNNVANTSTTFWQNTQKAANTFKNLILKPLNIFKR